MSGPQSDLGGVIYLHGKTARRWGRIHYDPAPGVCSVDDDGCGYCIGVPCKHPRTITATEEVHPDADIH